MRQAALILPPRNGRTARLSLHRLAGHGLGRWRRAAGRRRAGSHHRRRGGGRGLGKPGHRRGARGAVGRGGPGGIAVTAEIADWSARGTPALGVTLRVDGVAVAQGAVDLPAGGHARKRFLHSLPAEGGSSHDLVVEIDKDAFALDDAGRCTWKWRVPCASCASTVTRAPHATRTKPSSSRRLCATASGARWWRPSSRMTSLRTGSAGRHRHRAAERRPSLAVPGRGDCKDAYFDTS